MLCEIIRKVLYSRCPNTFENMLCNLINNPKYLMFIARLCCRLMVLFAMPCTVELSTKIGVGPVWGHPISHKMRWCTLLFYALVNNPPSSDSAADAVTSLSMPIVASKHPFSFISLLSGGSIQGRSNPPRNCARLVYLDAKH